MEGMDSYRVSAWVDDGGLLRAIASVGTNIRVAARAIAVGAGMVLASTTATNVSAQADVSASANHVAAATRAAHYGRVPKPIVDLLAVGKRVESGIANLNNPDLSDIDPDLVAAVEANLSKRG